MNKQKVAELALGLYILYWKDGGSSLAAVGNNEYGDRWFAPTNWIATCRKWKPAIPCYKWKKVKYVRLVADSDYLKDIDGGNEH